MSKNSDKVDQPGHSRGYRRPGHRPSVSDSPDRRPRCTPGPEFGDHSSSFIQHEPCPACASEDNLARYDDGHGYCFGCGHYEKGEPGTTTQLAQRRSTRTRPLLDGESKALRERGIDQPTCARFKYWTGELGGERVEIANYFSAEGERVAQKIRLPGKRFHWRGEPGRALLFGQQEWGLRRQYDDRELDGAGRQAAHLSERVCPTAPSVIITEGEIDAMSVAQVLGRSWPVVSVPNGTGGALRAIRRSFDWLSAFQSVVFLFDQDEAGANAAETCSSLFPNGQARVASLPLGDANDMLRAGRVEELAQAVWAK